MKNDLESEVKLPYILKNKVLFYPGVWNNWLYNEEDTKSAFSRTNWNSKEVKSLWFDHSDKISTNFAGFVENIKLNEDSSITGDLHITDKQLAMNLFYGAKFGVSPKIGGEEITETGQYKNFSFRNWSIVVTPACKVTYINNMEENIMYKTVENKEPVKDDKYPPVEAPKEEPKEEPKEVPKEVPEVPPVEIPEEPKSDEVNMGEFLVNLSDEELSSWTDFIKANRKDGKPISEIAKMFKAKKELADGYKNLSDEELNEMVKTASKLLSERGKKMDYPEPYVEEKKCMEEKLSAMEIELNNSKTKIHELSEQLNTPETRVEPSVAVQPKPKNISASQGLLNALIEKKNINGVYSL